MLSISSCLAISIEVDISAHPLQQIHFVWPVLNVISSIQICIVPYKVNPQLKIVA